LFLFQYFSSLDQQQISLSWSEEFAMNTLISIIFLLGITSSIHAAYHPLDPLTSDELSFAVAVLRNATVNGQPLISSAWSFQAFEVHEPPKQQVLAWTSGSAPLARAAYFVLKSPTNQYYETVVSITNAQVVSWKWIDSSKGQPGFTYAELIETLTAPDIVNMTVVMEFLNRGIDPSTLVCSPAARGGQFGMDFEEGTRAVEIICRQAADTSNYYFRPVEHLRLTVDLLTGRVLEYNFNTPVTVPSAQGIDFIAGAVPPRANVKDVKLIQPDGASFTLNDHVLNWQGFKMHLRLDFRTGMTISDISFADPLTANGARRSILYQATLSELYVPYMDNDIDWYFKSYMDSGEYGWGNFLSTAATTNPSCPEYAIYLNDTALDVAGNPIAVEKYACVFERTLAEPAWSHVDPRVGTYESRKAIELVVRTIATIGNYDYLHDTVFRQDGTISFRIGATGLIAVKGVNTTSIADFDEAREDPVLNTGTLVSPNRIGVFHDHYFNFRLDLDVDGPANNFVKEEIKLKRLKQSEGNGRKGIWKLDRNVLKKERAARLKPNIMEPSVWSVQSNNKSPVGNYRGYQISPSHTAISMLPHNDPVQKRARFSENTVWVTPYNADEKYAGGKFVVLADGSDGLYEWTDQNREITNRDIVVWYTLGMHHVVRQEDGPIMPTSWHHFELRPYNFFDGNAALNLPF
jgi:primary-amine oxidase